MKKNIHFRLMIFSVFLSIFGAEVSAQTVEVFGANTATKTSAASNKIEIELKSGETVTRQIAGGATDNFSIDLAAGEFINVVVDDGKFDGILSLRDSARKILLEVDYPTGKRDIRRILYVAETSGKYNLQVRQSEDANAASEYTIKIEELRAATEQDKSNIAANRVFGEASRLSVQDDGEAKKQAVAKYEEALSLFRKNGDRPGEARTLIKLSELLASSLSDYKRALEYNEQALPIWRELKDRAEEGFTLNEIGFCTNNLGDSQKALDYYNQALAIRREIKDVGGEGITLANIGTIYSASGNQEKAIEFYLQSLPFSRAVGDTGSEAITLGNIAASYAFLGDPNKAIEFYKQELPLERAVKSVAGEAYVLGNLGNTYYNIGERQIGLEYVSQALELTRKIGDRDQESAMLNMLGGIYLSLGNFEQALEMFKLSAQIRRDIGNKRYESVTLTNIGTVYFRQKDYAKAIEFYNQSLALSRAINNPIVESQTLNLIGNAFYASGDKQNALKYQTEALPIALKIKNPQSEAIVNNSLGIIYRDAGEWTKAAESLNRALELNRARRDRVSEAATLYHFGILEKSRGNLDEALKRIESAISIVESLRGSVAGNAFRTSYLATVQDYYNLRTEILMRLNKARPNENFDALALQSAENARARSLLELLKESRADIKQGVDTNLLEREKNLRQTLAAKSSFQMRLLGGKHTPEQATTIAAEIKKLADEYEQTQAEIRTKSPRYAALTQPMPLSVKQLQERILDPDTLLLEYALGDETSFLWVVGQNSLTSFEMPKRAEIETVARRVYEALTAQNQNPKDETGEQRRARIQKAEKDFVAASEDLSRMILAPAAAELKNKRLLIVADGALQYIPFAALQARTSKTAKRFLIEMNEIVILPSASTLALLRREAVVQKVESNSIAILADPVFAADDLRVSEFAKTRKKPVDNLSQTAATAKDKNPSLELGSVQRSARETGFETFARLRFSRDEAAGIAAIAPRANLLEAIDFAASKQTVLSADFGKHRIIHFATHGLINSQNPELSGVVLSLVDENGAPQDGFLRLFEIYNLKLDSELVVLSACRTALGKEIKGEGLVGLTRGFMYAGAPRVAASLWSIDDRATSELMRRFYRKMLVGGERPAAALRSAQVEMLKNSRFAAPYYWAAFTLQGEWR